MPKDPSKKKEKKEKSSSKKPKSSKVDAEVPAPAPAPDEPSSAPSVAPEPTPVDSDPTPSESQPMPGVATSVPDKSLIEIDTTLPAPLSKKEARKHKAKGLPPPAPVPASTIPQPSNSDDEDDEGGEDGETKKAKKEKKEKKEKKPEKFSIWIGNLAFKTSEEQLRAFLAPALKEGRKWGEKKEDGEAEPEEEGEKKDEEEEASITRVNLPKTGSGGKWGANKGFAYVDFSSAEACHRAVKLSEGHLDGRALLIKLGSDFSSRPVTAASTALPEGKTKSRTVQAVLAKQKNPPSPTLFVGNLGFEATEEALRTMIETHWETSLSKSRHSSKPKKSAFRPEPGEEEAAATAAQNAEEASSSDDDSDSDEEDEEAQAAKKAKREARRAAAKEKAAAAKKAGKGGEGKVVGDAVEKAAAVADAGPISGAGIRKIRMGQFQDTGRCKGFAFLDFHDSAQATAALIDMRNHRLDGRALTLEYASASAAARSGTGTQTFNTPIVDGEDAPADGKVRPAPTPRTTKKVRLMKKERIAAREAAGLPPTIPVDAPNNPIPPPRNYGGERLKAKRSRGDMEDGADGEKEGEDRPPREERAAGGEREKKKGKMAKWEAAGRAAPGAALAAAKRESQAIVQSQGKKMTFDD